MEMENFFFFFFFSLKNSVKPANGPQPRKVLWSVIFLLLPTPSVCADQNKHNIGAVSHRFLESVCDKTPLLDRNVKKKLLLNWVRFLAHFYSFTPVLLMIFLNFLSVNTKRGFNVINQNNHNFHGKTLWKKKQLSGTFFNDFFSSIRFAFRTRTKGRSHEFLTLKFIRGSILKKYDLNLHYPMASLSHFTALLAKIFKYEHHNIINASNSSISLFVSRLPTFFFFGR